MVGTGDSRVLDLLNEVPAEDLGKHVQEGFERELLDEAKARVKAQVSNRDWDIFRLRFEDNLSAAEVAARLGCSLPVVNMAKSRVNKLLIAELHRLAHGDGGEKRGPP